MNHFDLSDNDFIEEFKTCSLDPDIFSHEAHIRLVWICISELGLTESLKVIPKLISNFVKHVGATDKYNHTLTIAAIKVVDHFMRKTEATSFMKFIQENPKLINDFKALLAHHYSDVIFTSQYAKTQFLEPDLQPFC